MFRWPDSRDPKRRTEGLPFWKLHGSANWGYCDVCRSLHTAQVPLGKIALHFGLLIEADDFRLFEGGQHLVSHLGPQLRTCLSCDGKLGVRVATFSYRKHLEVPFLQTIWDEALMSLSSADRWMLIGYSLPEADIEVRHLLKTAELAHRDSAPPRIDVVLKSDEAAAMRYRRLFGGKVSSISGGGLQRWIEECLPGYVG